MESKSKKWFYTLCFIVVNGLDFVRNTQNGDIWSIAANAAGLVVMLIVASGYSLGELRGAFTYVWSALCACVVVAVLAWEGTCVFGVYKWAAAVAVLNVWWMGLYGKLLLQRIFVQKTLQVRISRRAWLWIVMTAFMTFSISGKVWPLWFFLMFGIFYLTQYKEQDRKDMLEGMINGTIISFFLLQIYAYGFRPYDELRYKGAFHNCNMTALHYLLVYVMVLFRLHLLEQKRAKRGWKLFYLAGAGGLLGFMFLTMGRTAWVTAAVLTVLYGVFVIRGMWCKKWRAVVARGAALVLSMLLLFPVVFGTVRWLPTILHYPVWYEGEYSVDKVHSYDPAASPKYIEADEFLDAVFGRIKGTFQVKSPFTVRAYAAENGGYPEVEQLVGTENMDTGLSIRLAIYKAYLRDLTFVGNPPTAGYYEIAGEGYHSWHAQNVWLQIAYTFGIPAGILFVVLTVILLRCHYAGMKRSTEWSYAMIPLFISIVFFTYGTMELVWNVGQAVLFLFFFVQHPGFLEKASEKGENACS